MSEQAIVTSPKASRWAGAGLLAFVATCVACGNKPVGGVDARGAHDATADRGADAVAAGTGGSAGHADGAVDRADGGAAGTFVPCEPVHMQAPGRPADAGAAATDAASETGPETLCSQGWCWSVRPPTDKELIEVWGSSATDVWAIASRTILHWNGAAWAKSVFAPAIDLTAIWGSGPNDVWAVGADAIYHWNGTSWSAPIGPPLLKYTAVWGSGPDDVWAVSNKGVELDTAAHWDGHTWSAVKAGAFVGVWGSGPKDVWAVNGGAWHWDGASWSAVPVGSSSRGLHAIWGSGANDVWAVGTFGEILHWNGAAWGQVATVSSPLTGVWGSGANDVWAVGTFGEIMHWNGTAWTSTFSRGPNGPKVILAVAPNDVWTPGPKGFLHGDGADWVDTVGGAAVVAAMWASGATDAWAVGAGGSIQRWDGKAWLAVPSGTTADLKGVWGSGPADVWAAGADGTILRWSGSAWSIVSVEAGTTFRGVWGSGPNGVWVAGDGATGVKIVHWDGLVWSERGPPPCVTSAAQFSTPTGIGGTDDDDVWIFDERTILHWDGTVWSLAEVDPLGPLFSMWAARPDDVWFGGDGSFLHWDGFGWSSVPSEVGKVWSLSGTGPDDVWAAGRNGILHWDGTSWARRSVGPLNAVWGVGQNVWVVGANGAILKR